MKKLAISILALGTLALPTPASAAHRHAHHARHHAHHALRHHRARAAWIVAVGCEEPTAHSWAEWRVEMLEAGFTQATTEEMEVCAEEEG